MRTALFKLFMLIMITVRLWVFASFYRLPARVAGNSILILLLYQIYSSLSIACLLRYTGGMKILGIETSCDETAAAVVELTKEGKLKLLSNVIASSVDLHAAYGGVVPEIAARSHLEHINPVISQALDESKQGWNQVDGIAVTQGPGLGGSLMIGVLTARTLAILHSKPLHAVNHVEAHVYGAFITEAIRSLNGYSLPAEQPAFPLLALIVSGGHSQLVLFRDHFDYQVLGRTLDDAVGEAFDKVAKIIGLPYPGGPSIEKIAQTGNPERYKLPIARLDNTYDFSFSGLKTAVLRTAQAEIGKDYTFPSHEVASHLTATQQRDIAASFQRTAFDTLAGALVKANDQYRPKSLVVAGGVAASQALRKMLAGRLAQEVIYPDIKLCTDNAGMVATNGAFQVQAKHRPADPFSLEFLPALSMGK